MGKRNLLPVSVWSHDDESPDTAVWCYNSYKAWVLWLCPNSVSEEQLLFYFSCFEIQNSPLPA